MVLLLQLLLPRLLQALQVMQVMLPPLVPLAPLALMAQDKGPMQQRTVPQQRLSPQPLPA